MDWLCGHLGHTKPVHKVAYRQMSGLIERVYVTKLMMVQDLNLTGKFKGQSLEEIDLHGSYVFSISICLQHCELTCNLLLLEKLIAPVVTF